MGIGEQVILFVCLILIVWYVIGLIYNRRRGIHTLNWLKEGLPILGGEVNMGWIGSANSGARIGVQDTTPPFQRMELVFLLESRELLLLWLADLLRGRRDRLILRATLRTRPHGEIMVLPAASRSTAKARQAVSEWSWEDGPHGLTVGHSGGKETSSLTSLRPFLEAYGVSLSRLSLQPRDPHLLLVMDLAGLCREPSTLFFEHLKGALGTAQTSSATHPG
jgi:hypothetical protein